MYSWLLPVKQKGGIFLIFFSFFFFSSFFFYGHLFNVADLIRRLNVWLATACKQKGRFFFFLSFSFFSIGHLFNVADLIRRLNV